MTELSRALMARRTVPQRGGLAARLFGQRDPLATGDPVTDMMHNLPREPARYGVELTTPTPGNTVGERPAFALPQEGPLVTPERNRLSMQLAEAATGFSSGTAMRGIVRRDPESGSGNRYLIERDGGAIGSATVTGEPGARFLDSISIYSPAKQRSGQGQQIYSEIEKLMGENLVPSPLGLYPAAVAIWQRRLAGMPREEAERRLMAARNAGVQMGAREDSVDARLAPLFAAVRERQ